MRGIIFCDSRSMLIKEEAFIMGDKNPKKREKKKKKVEKNIPAPTPKTKPTKKPKYTA